MAAKTGVVLWVDPAGGHVDAREALERDGFAVEFVSFDGAWTRAELPEFVVVDSSNALEPAAEFCRRWRETRADRPDISIIWLADSPQARMAGWQAGADAVFSRPLADGELAGQLRRLARQAEERAELARRADESSRINQTLLRLYEQNDADFRIARRIQRMCRPTQLPAVGRARFAVSHRERVGSPGDFHNVVRVDENRVGFFVGDVLGQSLTACMLAIFIHQNVATKEISGQTYRVLPPDEVLQRLARALSMLGMPDPPMMRMSYGLLDCGTGEMTFACAGHTPPLRLPAAGPIEILHATGPLLAPGDMHYRAEQTQLQPGDRVLLFTDGLPGAAPQPMQSFLSAVEARRSFPLPGLVATVTQDLLTQTTEPDDFTLLGLEFDGAS
jgi:serine phosphatase RsbU (regulator of sigma subunit)